MKISDLPECRDVRGLVTLGVNAAGDSVKVPIDAIAASINGSIPNPTAVVIEASNTMHNGTYVAVARVEGADIATDGWHLNWRVSAPDAGVSALLYVSLGERNNSRAQINVRADEMREDTIITTAGYFKIVCSLMDANDNIIAQDEKAVKVDPFSPIVIGQSTNRSDKETYWIGWGALLTQMSIDRLPSEDASYETMTLGTLQQLHQSNQLASIYNTIVNDYGWKDDLRTFENFQLFTFLTTLDYHFYFHNFSRLERIALPSSLTSIGDFAFAGCSSLREIEIPEGVTEIGYSAFSGCSSLERIVLPSSLVTVQDNAFAGCTSLKTIICKAHTAPTLASGVFGYDTETWVGYNSHSTQENRLYVPLDAEGYSDGQWVNPLRHTAKGGFTLIKSL